MKKTFLLLMTLFFMGSAMSMAYGFVRPITLRPVFLQVEPGLPEIQPTSLTNPLPCNIEAYQTETGVEIDANEVSLVGFYRIAVMGPREMMYYNSVLLNDGFSVFISTATWPEGTYLLYIEIPGGWLEGEFEIED